MALGECSIKLTDQKNRSQAWCSNILLWPQDCLSEMFALNWNVYLLILRSIYEKQPLSGVLDIYLCCHSITTNTSTFWFLQPSTNCDSCNQVSRRAGVSFSFNFSVLWLCKHTVEGQTRIITQTGRRASDFTYISPLIDTGQNLKPQGNTIHV